MKTIFIFFLIFSNFVHAQSIEYSKIEKSIQQYQQKVNTLQESIDTSLFDDEEILIVNDFDEEKIVQFLQEKFVYQHYVGLLRGVKGTLNSRAGNALDQSVLLAKLLEDAGFETRVANGKLSHHDALGLVNSIDNAQISETISKGEEFEKALSALTTNTQTKIDWQKTETYNRYLKSKVELEKIFKDNNLVLNNTNVTDEYIKQAQDYFWVEYRMGVTQEWKPAHPALKIGQEVTVKADNYFSKAVPKKYLHQLKIEAFIQQRISDKLSTHSLMKPWQKPVANLGDVVITYSNGASGSSVQGNIDEVVKKTTYFTPIFNGNSAGSKVFDLKGRLIDRQAMNSGAQGAFFQTLGNKMDSALGGLSQKGTDETLMQLTAQWLQFTFIHPNGAEVVQKRYLYQTDNFKVTKQTSTSAKLALMSEYNFLTSTGDQSSAYLANVYLSLIDDSIPLLHASAQMVFSDDEKLKYSKKSPANGFELLTQYKFMDSQPNSDNKIIKYKATANLLGFKQGFIDSQKAFMAVDVISNRKSYIIKKDNNVFQSTKAAFDSGVWETASEWLPSRFLGMEQSSLDTLQIQAAAKAQNIPMKILNSDDIKNFKGVKETIIQRLHKEIADGYMVVVPERTPTNAKMTGWWRINLTTGETLGMTADGGGQSIVEYLTQATQNALFLVRALGNLKKCQKLTNDVAKMCCLVEAHINNVGGLAFGNMMGAVFGTAGAAVFDIVDFAAEMATGTGIAPSTNGAICKKAPKIPNL